MATIELDHVIMVASDIDSAAARLLDEHGLASIVGGRHSGHGTGNRVVPLGSSYLEIMGVVDPAEARHSPLGNWVASAASEGDRLIALCLRTDDLPAVAERLGLRMVSMSRSRPDGAMLRWTLVGLDEMLADPARPFFIGWDVGPELHPGQDEAPHSVTPEGMAWVEIGGEAGPLRAWVGDHSLDLRVVNGRRGVTAVGISAGERILVVRT